MKFTVVAFSVAFAGFAAAQSLGDLPGCAQACVGSSFGGCGPLDIKCICANKDLVSNLSCCISSKCGSADQQKTIQFASQLCQAQGVTLPTSAVCSGSTSSGSSSTSAGSSSATGSSVSSSLAAAGASATSSAGSRASSLASSLSGAVASATSSVAAAASSVAAQATGAAPHFQGSGMGAAGAIVAALALL